VSRRGSITLIGSEATLSPFLTGTTVFDRFSGEVRTLNDLGRRQADLTGVVCAPDGGTGAPPDGGASAPDGGTGATR
jgi:hypothetical protein